MFHSNAYRLLDHSLQSNPWSLKEQMKCSQAQLHLFLTLKSSYGQIQYKRDFDSAFILPIHEIWHNEYIAFSSDHLRMQ